MFIFDEDNKEVYNINEDNNPVNIVFVAGDGEYNMRDPENNSDQDYEGNFRNPTEKYHPNNENLAINTYDVNIATVDHQIRYKDDNLDYLNDYDYQPKKEMTIPEKHYNFIKENFDFLEETGEVLEKDRIKIVNNTEDDINKIFNSISKDEKELLGANRNDNKWIRKNTYRYVVKRFIEYDNGKPIGFVDIFEEPEINNNKINSIKNTIGISVIVIPSYRGKGIATKLAMKAKEWFINEQDIWNTIYWSSRSKNKPSIEIAKNLGFKLDKTYKEDGGWVTYKLDKSDNITEDEMEELLYIM